jgi:hypothetical protein
MAAYNGGWDEGEGPPKPNRPSFFNILAQVNQTALPRAKKLAEYVETYRDDHVGPFHAGTYEAGPGYALNGLNNARVTREQAHQQELAMKSLAAGTATLDSFLIRAYEGFTSQNFFTFSEGQTWSSHAEWYRGGQAYPSWMGLALFNREALGDMLKTETVSVPSIDLAGFRRRQSVEDAPLAAVYATRNGTRYSVFVISRKVDGYPVEGDDGYIPVTLNLPFDEVNSITLHKMTGDVAAQNFTDRQVEIETVDVPAGEFARKFELKRATGADDRGLPPASTFLYVFETGEGPVTEAGTEEPAARSADAGEAPEAGTVAVVWGVAVGVLVLGGVLVYVFAIRG